MAKTSVKMILGQNNKGKEKGDKSIPARSIAAQVPTFKAKLFFLLISSIFWGFTDKLF